jgi:hypothetical protein
MNSLKVSEAGRTTGSPSPAKFAKFGGGSGHSADACQVCGKQAYLAERLEADGKIYHKKCFRCSECNKVQSTGSYAALKGKFFFVLFCLFLVLHLSNNRGSLFFTMWFFSVHRSGLWLF